MAKARKSARSPKQLRRQVEKLSREILKLANERTRLLQQIDQALVEQGESPGPRSEDEQELAQLIQANKGPLSEHALRVVFQELNSAAHALTHRTRVAYLGPEYTYSHLAALERFGTSAELVPVGGIAAVFEEVHRGQSDYGIVPLENSTDGRVADTLEMFTRVPVKICGEVQLHIHHCLLANCQRWEISEVYSKPQALSQCRNWLSRHLGTARLIEVTSTAAAAQLAAQKPGAAAIASRRAAVQHGLNIVAENIEDNPNNITRFAIIGHHSAPRTGKDKVALMFQIDHRVGALADTLMVFKRNRLNMTWIESFPIPDAPGTYLFFVELEGHESDLKVRRALGALEKKTLRLEVLGSYPQTEPVE